MKAINGKRKQLIRAWINGPRLLLLAAGLLTIGVAAMLPRTVSYAAPVSFNPATHYAAGINPFMVATGDLNGDLKLDLAVPNSGNNNVSILLGDGNGAFSAPTNFAVGAGSSPRSLAIGDLNGDLKPDLAVPSLGGNSVAVLLGDGTGSFGAAAHFAVGSSPRSAAIGDFNGDFKPDLAVVNANSNDVSILLGTGTGSFGAAATFSSGPPFQAPDYIVIGDLNGDLRLDVVTAASQSISILLGTGTGALGAPTIIAAANPFGLAIGDVNGDLKLDLAFPNQSNDFVTVMLGTGTGSFSGTDFAIPEPYGIAIGDIDGDLKPDLAVPSAVFDNVSVMLGNGAGSFGAPTGFGVGSSPRMVAIGDFNGDLRADLAVANVHSHNVSILLNTTASPACDLKITKTATPDPVQSGQPITITLTVENVGVGTCQGVTTVTDNLPGGFQVLSVAQGGSLWNCSVTGANPPATVTCTWDASIQAVPPGPLPPITITATVNSPAGSIQNCATVANTNDTNTANNQSCVSVQVTPAPVGGIVALSVTESGAFPSLPLVAGAASALAAVAAAGWYAMRRLARR